MKQYRKLIDYQWEDDRMEDKIKEGQNQEIHETNNKTRIC